MGEFESEVDKLMATNTTNYSLVKPALNETADIEVINNNMDIIDEAIKQEATNISTLSGSGGTVEKANKSTVDAHIGATGTAHGVATTSANGFMSSTDKTKLNGIETGATADMSASEILTAIKTVDGTGSGLDSDTLRGNAPSAFATSAQGTLADNAMPKSGGTFTGAVSMGRQNLNQPQLKDYSETVVTNASATGAVTLNIANGNVFNLTLAGATTLTFSNPATNGQACSFTLVVNQPTTAYAITYPSSVKWDNDVIPSLNDVSKTFILVFTTFNAGSRYYGRLAMGGMTT